MQQLKHIQEFFLLKGWRQSHCKRSSIRETLQSPIKSNCIWLLCLSTPLSPPYLLISPKYTDWCSYPWNEVYRGSYMGDHLLSFLINKFTKIMWQEPKLVSSSLIVNKFIKNDYKWTWIWDSIYHINNLKFLFLELRYIFVVPPSYVFSAKV